jgi:hypothetical protein
MQTTINTAILPLRVISFLTKKVFPIRKDQSVDAAREGGDPVYCEKHTQHINTAQEIKEMQLSLTVNIVTTEL